MKSSKNTDARHIKSGRAGIACADTRTFECMAHKLFEGNKPAHQTSSATLCATPRMHLTPASAPPNARGSAMRRARRPPPLRFTTSSFTATERSSSPNRYSPFSADLEILTQQHQRTADVKKFSSVTNRSHARTACKNFDSGHQFDTRRVRGATGGASSARGRQQRVVRRPTDTETTFSEIHFLRSGIHKQRGNRGVYSPLREVSNLRSRDHFFR